jgi:hypothetical protein
VQASSGIGLVKLPYSVVLAISKHLARRKRCFRSDRNRLRASMVTSIQSARVAGEIDEEPGVHCACGLLAGARQQWRTQQVDPQLRRAVSGETVADALMPEATGARVADEAGAHLVDSPVRPAGCRPRLSSVSADTIPRFAGVNATRASETLNPMRRSAKLAP